jgi:hypothetical protein
MAISPLFLAMVLASAHGGNGGMERVEGACAASSRSETRFFVETSGAVLPKARQGTWHELQSESELRALSESDHPPNTEAVVRTTRAGTSVSMYFQDASLSWAHVVDYCFRPAGPLARLRGTFNSYTAASGGAGIRRRRTIEYDAKGAVLRSKTNVFDLETDRPLRAPQFLDEEDPFYPTLRALPFATDLLPSAPVVEVDPSGVGAAVRERLPAVKACWDRAVKAKPGLSGKAVGRFTVDTTGKVTDFGWTADEIDSDLFRGCARKVIEAWRFPARDAPATVSFPFVFAGNGT